jgi:hypothetical protein
MVSIVFELDARHKFEVRRAIENEIILLKGRMELNKTTYGVEPHPYDINRIQELDKILSEIKTAKEIVRHDGETVVELPPSIHAM